MHFYVSFKTPLVIRKQSIPWCYSILTTHLYSVCLGSWKIILNFYLVFQSSGAEALLVINHTAMKWSEGIDFLSMQEFTSWECRYSYWGLQEHPSGSRGVGVLCLQTSLWHLQTDNQPTNQPTVISDLRVSLLFK